MVIVLALAVLAVLLAVVIRYRSGEPDPEQTDTQLIEVDPAEMSAPTDYWAPAIDDIRRENPDPAEQYARLMHYAYLKEEVAQYDEAIALYEAAAETAPSEQQQRRVWYRLYLRGGLWDRPELSDRYFGLLGQEWIDDYEQTAEQRRQEQGQ